MMLARKIHKTINQFFDSLTESQLENFNIKKNDAVIVSANTIKLTLKQLYGSFEIIHSDSTEETIGYWNNFKTVYRQAFIRIYDTLNAEYNPIENYNKISEITTEGIVSSTGTSEITNGETTEDNANFHNTSKSNGSTGNNANSTTTVIENTHGNIGVMTNMQMAREEYMGRIEMNLAKVICDMYAEMELI